MALKTKRTDEDVAASLDRAASAKQRSDCDVLVAMMARVTDAPAMMWGDSMVGFGSYRYQYKSGHEGEWFLTGFAPRKAELSLYIMAGFEEYDELLSRLGKHKTGKSCLYIKQLADVDLAILEELVRLSVEHMVRTNP